ncbi:MAG TPA: DUF262 domain-containing protein [Anaerolineales bacterium]|nr:DUF262 domain-containing protein [Anaerolineales bacterium]HRQ92925.1 DUF262 domain-containing protein [Anaerolineales bacterium]
MGSFNPKTQYEIIPKSISIKDFHDYKDEYVTRPPYQRKNVWSRKKQQDLLDSLFRRFYVPRIVVREVRLGTDETISEVIDGQQRIVTVQNFLGDLLSLPDSLSDVSPQLAGSKYSALSSEIRRFIDKELFYTADLIKGIDDPKKPEHQKIATEIFWRLQQGESLSNMEKAHSRLSSTARNFLVKYADDQTFDYEKYSPIDANPNKAPFFKIITRNNNRMQHLAILARLTITEEKWEGNNGPSDIQDQEIIDFIDRYQKDDGIGNYEFENLPFAKKVLGHLARFYKVFKNDPMLDEESGVKELGVEYFIISIYLLLRHLETYYVFTDKEEEIFRHFVLNFYARWKSDNHEDDTDILIFSENRQMSANEIASRHRILRQAFFDYLSKEGYQFATKDERRAFNESERIRIYRNANGLCKLCLQEGKTEIEARVTWSEYDADHVIPHSRGGQTSIDNSQLLCRVHNQRKGNRLDTES